MNQEKGIASLAIVIGLIVVLILIGGAVYFTQVQSHSSKSQSNLTQASEIKTASPSASTTSTEWKTYTDNTLHLDLQYPPGWSIAPSMDALGKYILKLTNTQTGDTLTLNDNWGSYQSVAAAFAAYTHNTQSIPEEIAGHSALKYEPQNDRQITGTHLRSVFFENSHNQIVQITLESKQIQAVGPTFKQFLSLIQDTN